MHRLLGAVQLCGLSTGRRHYRDIGKWCLSYGCGEPRGEPRGEAPVHINTGRVACLGVIPTAGTPTGTDQCSGYANVIQTPQKSPCRPQRQSPISLIHLIFFYLSERAA